MEIVHYIHLNKLWYYWLDDSEQKKYWRKIENSSDLNKVTLLSNEIITERQAKDLLKQMFPDNRIMKAIPYHYSPTSCGSRPKKITVDRKGMLQDKLNLRKIYAESDDATCKDCEHFLGMGDWNLCCTETSDLCYEDTPVCEKFELKE